MRRRDFIKVVAGSVAAWPLGTRAQPDDRKRRIGYLSPVAESDPENQSWVREFTQRLHELGWTDGRNVRIDFRFGNAVDPMRVSMLATELVEDHPDVVIASGLAAAVALRQQTLSIPIVFVQVVARSGDARAGLIHSRTFTGTSGSCACAGLGTTCRG